MTEGQQQCGVHPPEAQHVSGRGHGQDQDLRNRRQALQSGTDPPLPDQQRMAGARLPGRKFS